MKQEELVHLIEQVQKLNCETQTIEVKKAEKDCPNRIYDTLSSFSNQDEGGIILFGLGEQADFKVTGVYDAQDLQIAVEKKLLSLWGNPIHMF